MKALKPAAAMLVVIMALVWVRTCSLQRHHYVEAERYTSESNRKLAIREYDAAMHFYTPLSPYIEKSARQLWSLGEKSEKEGRPDWALIAYSSIRSSFYASRSFFTPGKEWIGRCDEKIADLNIKLLLREGHLDKTDVQSEREKYLYLLKADRGPDTLWTILAEVCFFGWAGSIILIAIGAIGRNGALRKKHALIGALSFASLFVLWAIALLKA
jgi:hypothetical protein